MFGMFAVLTAWLSTTDNVRFTWLFSSALTSWNRFQRIKDLVCKLRARHFSARRDSKRDFSHRLNLTYEKEQDRGGQRCVQANLSFIFSYSPSRSFLFVAASLLSLRRPRRSLLLAPPSSLLLFEDFKHFSNHLEFVKTHLSPILSKTLPTDRRTDGSIDGRTRSLISLICEDTCKMNLTRRNSVDPSSWLS